MRKILLKELSEKSGVSLSTLFRVLRNSPLVNRQTRERVVDILTKHGYVVENHVGTEKIVVDVSYENGHAENIAMWICSRLKEEKYEIHLTYSYSNPQKFQQAVENADVVIFSGKAVNDWQKKGLNINPDIYRISIFGECSEDCELSIAPDYLGAMIEAVDCLGKIFSNIAIFHNPTQIDSALRVSVALGLLLERYPQRTVRLASGWNDNAFADFHNEHGAEYDAYLFQNGDPWCNLEPLLQKMEKRPYTILINNPEHIKKLRGIKRNMLLDAYIDYDLPHIEDLVTFYMRNRPQLHMHKRPVVSMPTKFIQLNKKTKERK